jgi:transposase
MGTRGRRERQEELWVATAALARPASHPFYDRLNRLLEEYQFDPFVESLCKQFYAGTLGRPGLGPGIYFRLLMIGYFEGIDSERGIAWRAADSLGIRAFLRIALDEMAPDHSTISRTRRLIDLETHQDVFAYVLKILANHDLIDGKTIGVCMVAGDTGRARTVARTNRRDRRDDAGSERRIAQHRAARHRRTI